MSTTKSKAIELLESIDGPLTIARLVWAERIGEERTRDCMAEILGISVRELIDIEHGRILVSPDTAYVWGTLLGKSGKAWARVAAQSHKTGKS